MASTASTCWEGGVQLLVTVFHAATLDWDKRGPNASQRGRRQRQGLPGAETGPSAQSPSHADGDHMLGRSPSL